MLLVVTVLLWLHQAVLVATAVQCSSSSSCSACHSSVMTAVQMVLNVHWLVHMQWMSRCDVVLTVTRLILSTGAQRPHSINRERERA
jgi:hypothetical protein